MQRDSDPGGVCGRDRTEPPVADFACRTGLRRRSRHVAARGFGVALSAPPPRATALWFTVAYATARYCDTAGCAQAILGSGVGEITAGCVAGVFGLAGDVVLAGYARLAATGQADAAEVAALVAAVPRQRPSVSLASTAAGTLNIEQITDPAAWAARIAAPGGHDVTGAEVRLLLAAADFDPITHPADGEVTTWQR